MVMGGPGGATAESFLLPLTLGITVVSFVPTATIACRRARTGSAATPP
jgi:hypothetical protein